MKKFITIATAFGLGFGTAKFVEYVKKEQAARIFREVVERELDLRINENQKED